MFVLVVCMCVHVCLWCESVCVRLGLFVSVMFEHGLVRIAHIYDCQATHNMADTDRAVNDDDDDDDDALDALVRAVDTEELALGAFASSETRPGLHPAAPPVLHETSHAAHDECDALAQAPSPSHACLRATVKSSRPVGTVCATRTGCGVARDDGDCDDDDDDHDDDDDEAWDAGLDDVVRSVDIDVLTGECA